MNRHDANGRIIRLIIGKCMEVCKAYDPGHSDPLVGQDNQRLAH